MACCRNLQPSTPQVGIDDVGLPSVSDDAEREEDLAQFEPDAAHERRRSNRAGVREMCACGERLDGLGVSPDHEEALEALAQGRTDGLNARLRHDGYSHTPDTGSCAPPAGVDAAVRVLREEGQAGLDRLNRRLRGERDAVPLDETLTNIVSTLSTETTDYGVAEREVGNTILDHEGTGTGRETTPSHRSLPPLLASLPRSNAPERACNVPQSAKR